MADEPGRLRGTQSQMAVGTDFRVYAEDERAAASRETLPNRKAMHERAAIRWDALADEYEGRTSAEAKSTLGEIC
jgi:hypothetical protein